MGDDSEDLPKRLRWFHSNCAARPGVLIAAPLVEAAEEIERLHGQVRAMGAAIDAWADEISASEGVLFLPPEPHRSVIEAHLVPTRKALPHEK